MESDAPEDSNVHDSPAVEADNDHQPLLAHVTKQQPLPPSDL